MKNIIVAGMVVLLLTVGCATMMSFEEREKTYGKEAPVITETFASKQMNPADTWKVYLKASDPDGDMESVVAVVEQSGLGPYPVSFTKLREGNRKELSGYVFLNTSGPQGSSWLHSYSLTLTVQVKDKAGHYSQPAVFAVSFNNRFTQQPPPPGIYEENNLGPILVVLRPIDGGAQTDFD